MTAGVAHEVRNPLGIISSTAELLQARLARYEPQDRLARIIVEEANRLNEKVTEFLDFARPRLPNLRPCDLEAVLDRGLEFLEPEIQRIGSASPGTTAQRPDAGGGPGSFASGLLKPAPECHPGHARGWPAPGDRQTRAPRPRQRDPLRRQRRRHRTGEPEEGPQPLLHYQGEGQRPGLPIVKSIIETHQGSLKIDSTVGQGTVVTIILPELSLKKPA